MLKISWRTTSDMSKPQFDKPAGGELHHGRGEQRRQARSLVRPPQHPAMGEHHPDPRRPRLPARGRHHHDPHRRPPAGLAGLSAADQCRGQRRAAHLGRCLRDLRVLRARASGVRSGAGPGRELEGDLPSLAVAGEPFRLALVAEDMWGNPTDEGRRSARARAVASGARPAVSVTVKAGEGPRVIEDLRRRRAGDIELKAIGRRRGGRARQSAARGRGARRCAATGATCTARAARPSAWARRRPISAMRATRPSSTWSATRATTSRSPMRSGRS